MLKREIIIESNQLTCWQGHFHLAISLLLILSFFRKHPSSLFRSLFSPLDFLSILLFFCIVACLEKNFLYVYGYERAHKHKKKKEKKKLVVPFIEWRKIPFVRHLKLVFMFHQLLCNSFFFSFIRYIFSFLFYFFVWRTNIIIVYFYMCIKVAHVWEQAREGEREKKKKVFMKESWSIQTETCRNDFFHFIVLTRSWLLLPLPCLVNKFEEKKLLFYIKGYITLCMIEGDISGNYKEIYREIWRYSTSIYFNFFGGRESPKKVLNHLIMQWHIHIIIIYHLNISFLIFFNALSYVRMNSNKFDSNLKKSINKKKEKRTLWMKRSIKINFLFHFFSLSSSIFPYSSKISWSNFKRKKNWLHLCVLNMFMLHSQRA